MSCRPMGGIDTKLGIFLFTAKHRGIVGGFRVVSIRLQDGAAKIG